MYLFLLMVECYQSFFIACGLERWLLVLVNICILLPYNFLSNGFAVQTAILCCLFFKVLLAKDGVFL